MHAVVGSSHTLVIGGIVAAALLIPTGELTGYLESRFVYIDIATPVVAASPVALLVAREEFDLSGFGTAAFGGYLYAEVASTGPGLAAAAFAGLTLGTVVGLARFALRAPSAYVSLAFGLAALHNSVAYSPRPSPPGPSTGFGPPPLPATASAPTQPDKRSPGPEIIAAYALAGLGTTCTVLSSPGRAPSLPLRCRRMSCSWYSPRSRSVE